MPIEGRRLTATRALAGLVLCAVLATTVVACVVNLSGLTGGAPPQADGSISHVDGHSDARQRADRHADGGSDARSDAPGTDAPPTDAPSTDAARDAPSDAPADSSAASCPGYPAAIFCDNFDDAALGARWTTKSVAFGSLTLSDAQAVSPPWSMLAEVFEGGTSGEGTASLVLDLPHAFGRIRTSYDVNFDMAGMRSAAIGSVYLLTGASSYYGLYLFARGGGSAMDIAEDGALSDGGGSFVTHPFAGAIPTHVWLRVILDVDFGASTFSATLEQPPGSPTVSIGPSPITPTIIGTRTSVVGGIDYVAFPETTGWRVFVDNVVIEAP